MPADNWIDVHAHFSPPMPEEFRKHVVDVMRIGDWNVDEAPAEWNVEDTLAYMNGGGIQMQTLSNVPKAHDALRASNDYGAALGREHPRRFGFRHAPSMSAARYVTTSQSRKDL